jgi:Mg-chelatase subunit ChlD
MIKMTAEGKEQLQLALRSVKTGGGTDISGGVFRGILQQQADAMRESRSDESCQPTRAVFVLSDGYADGGILDADRLAEKTRELLGVGAAEQRRPATGSPSSLRLHTFGFGSCHEPKFLGKLAEGGEGNYYGIEEPAQVAQVSSFIDIHS